VFNGSEILSCRFFILFFVLSKKPLFSDFDVISQEKFPAKTLYLKLEERSSYLQVVGLTLANYYLILLDETFNLWGSQ